MYNLTYIHEDRSDSDFFQQYLLEHKKDAYKESNEGFYHENIVAESNPKGYSYCKKSEKKDFISGFIKQKE